MVLRGITVSAVIRLYARLVQAIISRKSDDYSFSVYLVPNTRWTVDEKKYGAIELYTIAKFLGPLVRKR